MSVAYRLIYFLFSWNECTVYDWIFYLCSKFSWKGYRQLGTVNMSFGKEMVVIQKPPLVRLWTCLVRFFTGKLEYWLQWNFYFVFYIYMRRLKATSNGEMSLEEKIVAIKKICLETICVYFVRFPYENKSTDCGSTFICCPINAW